MSTDYPDRADWLAVRRKVRAKDTRKWAHQSVVFRHVKGEDGVVRTVREKGVTFDVGRNKEKRQKRLVAKQ